MIDDFNVKEPTEIISGNQNCNAIGPFGTYCPPKHRKPKGKKATKKALKKTECERDQLLVTCGYISAENMMLKRAITLAVAANRRQLDDNLSEDALRLLPPQKRR